MSRSFNFKNVSPNHGVAQQIKFKASHSIEKNKNGLQAARQTNHPEAPIIQMTEICVHKNKIKRVIKWLGWRTWRWLRESRDVSFAHRKRSTVNNEYIKVAEKVTKALSYRESDKALSHSGPSTARPCQGDHKMIMLCFLWTPKHQRSPVKFHYH